MKKAIIIVILFFSELESVVAQQFPPGKILYEKNCAKCHGKTGTRGFLGAKNLQISKLNDNQLFAKVREGKGLMPSWKDRFSTKEIELVIHYVKTLRGKS